MKTLKIAYFASTGLFTALMLMSAGMYIFNNAEVSKTFVTLGYPTYIIYPLATAKILGALAIWVGGSQTLKEWAYAGFFFDALLAFAAHTMVGDGEFVPSLLAMILILVSYNVGKKLSKV